MYQDNKYQLRLNLKGELKTWYHPLIMGILNITEDSFYEGSCIHSIQEALDSAGKMLDEGADILDIGAQSTRPGVDSQSAEQELARIIPMIEAISKHFPKAILSVDTFYSSVSNACIHSGAHIINDISAGEIDPENTHIAAQNSCPYIAMHMQGTPKTMQNAPSYHNVCQEVTHYLGVNKQKAETIGISDFIADVGFGFGKTISHNYSLLRNLSAIKHILQTPILVGVSRKSMLWKLFNSTPQDMLPSTSALHLFALQQGADILRVHDVKEAIQVRILWTEWLNGLYLPSN